MSYHGSQAAGSHSDSYDTRTSQLEQPIEQWKICIEENSDIDRRWPSIFRVPNDLKKESKGGEAYIPTRVSLGPYHFKSSKLTPMESHKKRALHRMMTRANHISFLEEARKKILSLEDEIRNNYEEKIDYDRETLALMLGLDGCFVLEVLRTQRSDILPSEERLVNDGYGYYEPLFHPHKTENTASDILLDILKVENQIPFIVLRNLIELELDPADHVHVDSKLLEILSPLLQLCPFKYQQFNQYFRQYWPHSVNLLDFLHTFIVSPDPPVDAGRRGACMGCGDEGYRRLPDGEDESVPRACDGEDENVPRAVELRNAGIKFEARAEGIMGIDFDPESATIYLPPLIIDDTTEVLFRNLIAFEMCNPFKPKVFVSYILLMDLLIDSQEDVALLKKMEILTNCLGSDLEVAQLFNGLSKGVVGSLKNVFGELTHKVNLYYKNECQVYYAELMSEYCSSPWKILGLVGGIVLLLLTVVQTIFTILSVIK